MIGTHLPKNPYKPAVCAVHSSGQSSHRESESTSRLAQEGASQASHRCHTSHTGLTLWTPACSFRRCCSCLPKTCLGFLVHTEGMSRKLSCADAFLGPVRTEDVALLYHVTLVVQLPVPSSVTVRHAHAGLTLAAPVSASPSPELVRE